eukprot:2736063-Rhodomonas_salina.1
MRRGRRPAASRASVLSRTEEGISTISAIPPALSWCPRRTKRRRKKEREVERRKRGGREEENRSEKARGR